MRDAFEVALVDASGRSLTYTIAGPDAVPPASVVTPPALPPYPDALFNHSDGQTPFAAPGTALSSSASGDRQLAIDVSHLASGSTAIFRLINNDRDRATTVRIANVDFRSAMPDEFFTGSHGPTAALAAALARATDAEDRIAQDPSCYIPSGLLHAISPQQVTLAGHPTLIVVAPQSGTRLSVGSHVLNGFAQFSTTNTFAPPTSTTNGFEIYFGEDISPWGAV